MIRVTVEDLDDPTHEPEVAEFDNDYLLITAGSCYEHSTQLHGNGTHVITVKGRRR